MLTILALLVPALAQDVPAPLTPPVPLEAPASLEAPATPAMPALPELPGLPALPAIPRLPTIFEADQDVVIGSPSNDLFAVAQDLSVGADVADNAFLMGQDVKIGSPVRGDVYAMGEHVTVDAPVSGDVYAMAGDVTVTENGSIGGNLYVGAGEVEVRAPVGGDLRVGAGQLLLAAPITGNAELEVGEVMISGAGAIGGSLSYTAPEPIAPLEAVTAGAVGFTVQVPEADDTDWEEPAEDGSWLGAAVWWGSMRTWGWLTKFMVGALLLFVGGERAAAIGRRIVTHPGQTLGAGFVTATVLPVLSLAAILLIVPFPLGVLGFVAYGIALYLGQIFAAHAAGDAILRQFRPGAVGSPTLSLAIGLVPLILLGAIPWIGTLVWWGATLMGIGALVASRRAAR